jgi:hypothetical protein
MQFQQLLDELAVCFTPPRRIRHASILVHGKGKRIALDDPIAIKH